MATQFLQYYSLNKVTLLTLSLTKLMAAAKLKNHVKKYITFTTNTEKLTDEPSR